MECGDSRVTERVRIKFTIAEIIRAKISKVAEKDV